MIDIGNLFVAVPWLVVSLIGVFRPESLINWHCGLFGRLEPPRKWMLIQNPKIMRRVSVVTLIAAVGMIIGHFAT